MDEKGYLNQKKLETNAPLRNHPHPKWVRFEIDLPPVRANHTTTLTVVTAHRTPAFVASTAISSVVAVAMTMVTLVTMVTMIEMVAVAALAMVAEVVVTIEVSPAAGVAGEVAGSVSLVLFPLVFVGQPSSYLKYLSSASQPSSFPFFLLNYMIIHNFINN